MVVGMLHQSSQDHCGSQFGRGLNVDRRRYSRVAGSQNDFNVLDQSLVLNNVLKG
ncbi:unnamed protein product [Prunus brigantina]